jgi:hypothetical protein
VAINRIDEALALVNDAIENNKDEMTAVQLYVLRARLYLKCNNVNQRFYSLGRCELIAMKLG